MDKSSQLPVRGLQILIQAKARQGLRTFIFFSYFVVFQILILTQKPFLQFDFIFQFYSYFSIIFLHHFFIHFKDHFLLNFKNKKYSHDRDILFFSYLLDFIMMILFMRSFPQLSSFLLVLQLFTLFISSFDLSFVLLCTLGFIASVGTSVMNLSAYQAGSTQSILSLALFNLSYFAVILISGQLKEEIFNLQSDLFKTSKKLKSQAEFSKTLIEKMPLGLIVSQDNNQILLENNYLKTTLNYNQFDIDKLLSLCRSARFKNSAADLLFENNNNNNNQGQKIFHIDQMKYFDEEIEENLNITLIKDVTEVRLLENQLKQKEKLAAVGQLAAGIAHEIRNPLAGISGSIQMLAQDTVDSDQQKLMKIILKEIDRLNNLISEFLDYAKPEKKPDHEVDLKSLVEETVQSLKLQPNARAELIWNLKLDPLQILGRSEKLKQAFLNIIINSIQALQDRPDPTISISLFQDLTHVNLIIKDNGVGIPLENQKKIFEPFHTTKPKGTGLGLAITHKIIDSHGGDIQIKSDVNQGLEFIIKFPLIG